QRQLELFFTRFIFLIFLLYFVRTQRQIEFTTWLLIGLIVFAAADAFLAFTAGGGMKRAASDLAGLTKNSNRLAYTCIFGTALIWFYNAYGLNKQWKALLLPLLFFLPIMTLIAGSRSGLLQMIALAVLIGKDQQHWSVRKRLGTVFLVACVALLSIAVVPERYLDRVTAFDPDVHTTSSAQDSSHNRIHAILVGLRAVASSPLLGIGIGNNWILKSFFEAGLKAAPHNSYLWALLSGGIGALVLYLAMFLITYRMLRRLEQWGPRELLWVSKGLKVNLILFLIFSLFADFWLNFFLYAIVGLTIAMTVFAQQQNQRMIWAAAPFASQR
ncbi:MAG: O-antigen ligase family protein, partial [Candidatus Binatia bacterium]